MSERNTAQDPSAAGTPAWDESVPTNRPAEGATHVESVQRVAPAWNAGTGATDFLGLEQEVPVAAELPTESTSGETRTWLFDVENNAAPTATSEAAEANPTADATAPVDPALDPLANPEPESAPVAAAAAPRGRRRAQWLAAAALLACLGGVASWKYWSSRPSPAHNATSSPVATRVPAPRPSPAKPTPPAPKPTPPAELPTAVVEPELAVAEAPPIETPDTRLPESVTSVAPELTPPEAASPAFESLAPFVSLNPRASEPLGPVVLPKGVRRPSAGELANLWTESAIPVAAITGERELRTPRVGAVRVLLKNGEHVQGHLHSVGMGRLSVDVDLGRMAIEYRDVGELVQIVESDLSKKPTGGLPDETTGLPLVSARVPGGFVTGWLVNQDQGKLTLITEYARKVTIDDRGYEAVGQGKARVVGALAQRK